MVRGERQGNLASYNETGYAPQGFDGDLPYAAALLDYGDYKVFGRIANSVPEEEELKVGMELETVPNTLANGQLNFVFQKPA